VYGDAFAIALFEVEIVIRLGLFGFYTINDASPVQVIAEVVV
jgi:hypothetical protein